MYAEHFRLSDTPFNNAPGDGLFTPNDEFESAVSSIEQVLMSRDAVALVSGGPGVGKTTLISTAAGRVGDQALVAYIDMRLTNPDLLYDLLLLKLGGESGDGDQATSLCRLKQVIARHHQEQGRKVTAVIDVSSLTIERAKRIMQLIHMTGDPDGQLNVVLLGPHALHKLLDAPGLIHIRQRVIFRYRVRPLTVAETEDYINAQIERAGGQGNSIMVHGTSILLFKYVGGVPRLINTMMNAALSYAAEHGMESVTPATINEVAQLLGWRRLSDNKSSAPIKRNNAAAKAKPPKKESATPVRPKEDPSPLEEMALSLSEADSPASKVPDNHEGTAMLMAAALDIPAGTADDKPETKPDNELSLAEEEKKADKPSVPEMDAEDTSATGMLRLEDLDARFAETIFGDDFKKAAG